ncbi:TIM barrel protein [bacterium]|nr:TIM barrel protein [bacterium]
MKKLTRRSFIGKSLALGAAGLGGLTVGSSIPAHARLNTVKDDISLAQYALVKEIRDGLWENLDFPRIAREDFDINGIEFVAALFGVPIYRHLKQLKRNADNHGVTMVLIMVSGEGSLGSSDKKERKQAVINHRKWIDIAAYLGCHAIRTDCHETKGVPPEETLKYAAESYNEMLEYAIPAKVSILVENHGGVSDDPDMMIALMKEVNNLYFGTLPDWREPGGKFDNVERVRKLLPYAQGMSFRNQPTDELTEKMIKMCRDGGYRGFYGIESGGREAIKRGKKILDRVLFGKE